MTDTAEEKIPSPGLTSAARILTWIVAAVALAMAVALSYQAWRFNDWWDSGEGLSDFRDAEDLTAITITVYLASFLIWAVLALVWLYLGRRTADRFGPSRSSWPPTRVIWAGLLWLVGPAVVGLLDLILAAWLTGLLGVLVPLTGIVMVKLAFVETERVSNPLADPVPVGIRWKDVPLEKMGTYWFSLWLIGGVVIGIGAIMIAAGDDGDLVFDSGEYLRGLVVTAAGAVIVAFGLVAFAAMLKQIDGQLRRTPVRASGDRTTSLTFDDVSMVFPDGTHAVDHVSFSVEPGEFVTVVGPSGCGKSTLLKIASGLLEPSGGSVDVDRERLGYVFQDATLLHWRTVEKNVELFTELHGYDPKEREQLAKDAIELVGLTGFEDHYPRSLSGGMKMRVSLARTLTLSPPVFLFDEPFGAVDEITREHLNEETLRLFELEGFAGLFITHSISEAVFMSTRVLVMSSRPGRIVAEYEIPFPYPRRPELRFDPQFATLSGEISLSLRGAHT